MAVDDASRNPHRFRLRLVALVALVVIAVCFVDLAVQARTRTCISEAEARYPAVPVSAFSGEQTGPLKVSFVAERQRAVDDCGLF